MTPIFVLSGSLYLTSRQSLNCIGNTGKAIKHITWPDSTLLQIAVNNTDCLDVFQNVNLGLADLQANHTSLLNKSLIYRVFRLASLRNTKPAKPKNCKGIRVKNDEFTTPRRGCG